MGLDGTGPALRGWILPVFVALLAGTGMACDDGAAKRSDAATTVYLIELKSGAESTFQRAAELTKSDKTGEATHVLKVRLDGLEEQVTKYIVTDPELLPADRERIIEAVRNEQRQIRDLLRK